MKDDADKRIKGKLRKKLIDYLRENHPGHTRAYQSKEDNGDDDE